MLCYYVGTKFAHKASASGLIPSIMEWLSTFRDLDWRIAAGGIAAALLAGFILKRTLSPRKRLQGQVVVVTGASSGIGREVARQLALLEGATVIALARRAEKLTDLRKEVEDSNNNDKNGSIVPVACDCSSGEDVKQAVKAAGLQKGQVVAVINNAGTGLWKFLHELDGTDEIHAALRAPIAASLVTTKAFLPMLAKTALRRQQECSKGMFVLPSAPIPRILTVTSPASAMPMAGATCYSVSRQALRGFTKCMRADLRSTGIEAQEVMLGEVSSSYWQNNPGSRKSLPGIAVLLPVLSEEQAGGIIVQALAGASSSDVVAPVLALWLTWLHAAMPLVVETVMYSTAPATTLEAIAASGMASDENGSEAYLHGGGRRPSSRSSTSGDKNKTQ